MKKQSKIRCYIALTALLCFIFAFNSCSQKKQTSDSEINAENAGKKNNKTRKAAVDENNFSDSPALKDTLNKIRIKAKNFNIEVEMKHLKPYYDQGPGMISIEPLRESNAEKYGFSLPEQSEMTDEEFDKKKHFKCKYEDKGWVYLDNLPKTSSGIEECWAQHYGYGKGQIAGDQIWFQAGHRKTWNKRKWDEEESIWTNYTAAEERIAEKMMFEEKAREAVKNLEDHDETADMEMSEKLLKEATEKMDKLKDELNTFSSKEIRHYEKAIKYGQFNEVDKKISKLYQKINSQKDKLRYAIIYEYTWRIKRIGFYDWVKRKGLEL